MKKEDTTKEKVSKIFDWVVDILIIIPFLIPILIAVIECGIWEGVRRWIISKKYHIPKRKTHEEKLDYLMLNWFQCEKIQI